MIAFKDIKDTKLFADYLYDNGIQVYKLFYLNRHSDILSFTQHGQDVFKGCTMVRGSLYAVFEDKVIDISNHINDNIMEGP